MKSHEARGAAPTATERRGAEGTEVVRELYLYALRHRTRAVAPLAPAVLGVLGCRRCHPLQARVAHSVRMLIHIFHEHGIIREVSPFGLSHQSTLVVEPSHVPEARRLLSEFERIQSSFVPTSVYLFMGASVAWLFATLVSGQPSVWSFVPLALAVLALMFLSRPRRAKLPKIRRRLREVSRLVPRLKNFILPSELDDESAWELASRSADLTAAEQRLSSDRRALARLDDARALSESQRSEAARLRQSIVQLTNDVTDAERQLAEVLARPAGAHRSSMA